MGKFMNKRELVLVVLLILVFDFNGFCDLITSHIPFKKKFNYLTYLLGIAFLLFDIYVFHYIIDYEPEINVPYAVNKKSDNRWIIDSSDDDYQKVIDKQKEMLQEEKDKDKSMFEITEKIVVNFVAIWVSLMIIFCLYYTAKSKSPHVNTVPKVILLLVPLILLVSSLLSFGNIYLNLSDD